MERIEHHASFGGRQEVWKHASRALGCEMRLGVYLPPAETRIAQERLEGIFEGSYANFAFAKDTGWHGFVTFLYGIK